MRARYIHDVQLEPMVADSKSVLYPDGLSSETPYVGCTARCGCTTWTLLQQHREGQVGCTLWLWRDELVSYNSVLSE